VIKIDVAASQENYVLGVQGGITDIFVGELERCWRAAREIHPRHITVNLEGVTRVDPRGRQLLAEMHREGVEFTGARLAIQDIVREAQTASSC
jgi:ABC-type transporter Mla MlaB component